MCGIIGVTGVNKAAELLLEGLRKLEYRGYDSAGIALIENNSIRRFRAQGKIINLEKLLLNNNLSCKTGIGHTRWATHGEAIERNAHPHSTERVAVVHNGIIENYIELKENLQAQGYHFFSDTDTEVIAVLMTYHLDKGMTPKESFFSTVEQLEGAYAIAVIFHNDEKERIFVSRHGAPLVIGYGQGCNYIASDAIALIGLSNRISYLDEGDVAEIAPNHVNIWNRLRETVTRAITISNYGNISIGKENYRHFMLKEIFEQPTVMSDNIKSYFNSFKQDIVLPNSNIDFREYDRIEIVACGTSYYAASCAKYWIEATTHFSVEIDIASEYRYREKYHHEHKCRKTLAIFVSQSGETADTLAALKHAKDCGKKIISVVNTTESSIAREADLILPIYSGPEIGVASTKAFTAQLMTFAILTLKMAKATNSLSEGEIKSLYSIFTDIPSYIAESLKLEEQCKNVAGELATEENVIYIGRSLSYPIAMEGALKLKEISYIHSEAFASGELKHGPIAMIEENLPIVAIAPEDSLFAKSYSNIKEISARKGKVILITNADISADMKETAYSIISIPKVIITEEIKKLENSNKLAQILRDIINPLICTVPIQLIAYYTAVAKGTDVDQPRNLAKSVTVE